MRRLSPDVGTPGGRRTSWISWRQPRDPAGPACPSVASGSRPDNDASKRQQSHAWSSVKGRAPEHLLLIAVRPVLHRGHRASVLLLPLVWRPSAPFFCLRTHVRRVPSLARRAWGSEGVCVHVLPLPRAKRAHFRPGARCDEDRRLADVSHRRAVQMPSLTRRHWGASPYLPSPLTAPAAASCAVPWAPARPAAPPSAWHPTPAHARRGSRPGRCRPPRPCGA